MDEGTVTNGLIILAIIVGPIAAVQIDRYLERKKEKQNSRLIIFRALMATRKSILSVDHVRALNLIDVEFYGEKDVVDAWKEYLDQLCVPRGTEPEGSSAWRNKCDDLLVELLFKMAKCLDFVFDKTHIRRNAYIPMGHEEVEIELRNIRKEFLKLLSGEKSLPVDVKNFPPGDSPA